MYARVRARNSDTPIKKYEYVIKQYEYQNFYSDARNKNYDWQIFHSASRIYNYSNPCSNYFFLDISSRANLISSLISSIVSSGLSLAATSLRNA